MEKLARHVATQIMAENGGELSVQLSTRNEAYVLPASREFFELGQESLAAARLEAILQRVLPPGDPSSWSIWSVIIQNQMRAVACLSTDRWKDAAERVSDSLFEFNKFMANEANQGRPSWWLPVLWMLCRESRFLAKQADLEMELHRIEPTTMASLEERLKKCFGTCNNDKRANHPDSLRRGAVEVANQLFRVYFRLNKVPLCDGIIRGWERKSEVHAIPRAHLVTYKYFYGRIKFIGQEYGEAEKALTFAWQNTPRRFISQRRKILEYLVPTGLLQRRMVSRHIVSQYNLPLYQDLREACTSGDITLFRRLLQQNMLHFVRRGLYIALEALRLYPVMSTLFRQLHRIQLELADANAQQGHLSLDEMVAVLNALGQNIEIVELECMLCTMIYHGYIKGYVSHRYRKLVVNRAPTAKPFPIMPARDANQPNLAE
ncbi:PCI domain-containing protein 2-like [Porphyridium purpureum]|uniref:PCI domain-containing protein 2-like n=1 Tax=Porphyridium purpureum TaxID=35688 RepID=A0A5J4YZA5_PORPP|nr:PCI domain-containing protein 2-like [Porphyridium purpureum]|eukprot:POR8451..scf208_2